jgi:tetratricopeptide (TPR) repeat protein
MNLFRPLLMMFYAPARGLSEVRDRAPLGSALLLAVVMQSAYSVYTLWGGRAGPAATGLSARVLVDVVLIQPLGLVLLIGVILVPITIFVANLFERRGSFALAIQQEYAPLASTIFYAWAAASLIALPLSLVAHSSGLEAATIEAIQKLQELQGQMRPGEPPPPGAYSITWNAARDVFLMFLCLPLPWFGMWAVISVRAVFRLAWWRTIAIALVSGVVVFPATIILMWFAGWLFTSPFLILLLFFILRGRFGEVMRAQRDRAAFQQNLEAATLNPADASAHYNLGLIHQQRNELEEARRRFERAIEIDPEEVDAHYQLGRIARAQERLPDAIAHFEQAVARDPTHAQHEIWREIGATYLAAGQFEDALDALQRFLDHRGSDPEGLYLRGRAHAGLGHRREAADSMQACIEAVKTAPAYKYRTDKRWLNEAQQFIKSSQ